LNLKETVITAEWQNEPGPIDNTQAKTPCFAPYHFDPNAQTEDSKVIFDRLLKERDIAVWLAREKSGKSTLLLQLCMCAAAGRAFLNFPLVASHPLKVVIIDYESDDGVVKKRYESILKDLAFSATERDLVQHNLTILLVRKIRAAGEQFPPLPVPNATKTTEQSKSVKFWNHLPTDYPADMYCIDPLRLAHIGDENDSKISGLMESLQTIFRGKTVVIPHHLKKHETGTAKDVKALTKDMRDWSERGRGSTAIKAHADVIICMAREVDSNEDAVYWGAFGRDMEDIAPMKLEAVTAESFALKVAGGFLPGEMQEHWDLIREHFKAKQTFTQAELVQALHGAGVSRATAYRRFNAFQNRGLIVAAATVGTYGFGRSVRQQQEDSNNQQDNCLTEDETVVNL
jgi:hypothetical protein